MHRHSLRPQEAGRRAGRAVAGGAQGKDHDDGQLLDALDEPVQEPQRRLVRPLGVVDGDEDRPAFGEVQHQPEQAVEVGQGVGARCLHCRGASDPEQLTCQGGGAGEQLGGVVLVANQRREQLGDHAVGQGPFELPALCPEHVQPTPSRLGGRVSYEGGLADSRLALDEQRGAGPGFRCLDRLLDTHERRLALEHRDGLEVADGGVCEDGHIEARVDHGGARLARRPSGGDRNPTGNPRVPTRVHFRASLHTVPTRSNRDDCLVRREQGDSGTRSVAGPGGAPIRGVV